MLVENRDASRDAWERSRARRGWRKSWRKTSRRQSATLGIGNGPGRLHAPVAGTLPPHRGLAHHPGAFPWREPCRASGHTACGALGSGTATRQGRAKPSLLNDDLVSSCPKNLCSFRRDSALFFVRARGLGTTLDEGAARAVVDMDGFEDPPEEPDEPADKRDLYANLGGAFRRDRRGHRATASMCAFHERRVGLAKRPKSDTCSRRDASTRHGSTDAIS